MRLAAEALGVAVNPCDRAAHLLGHRHEVAARLQDVDEVRHHVVRAGVHEKLRRVAGIPREPAAPGAAVDEDVDRGVRTLGYIDVQRLDCA
jgi:hypothetical protein